MKLSSLTADATLAAGTWIAFGGGLEFKLASTTRPEFQRALDKARRGISQHLLDNDRETQAAVFEAALADACVLEWKGLDTEDGSPMPVTRENKTTVLRNPTLRDWLAAQCGKLANFQAEAVAGDAESLKS